MESAEKKRTRRPSGTGTKSHGWRIVFTLLLYGVANPLAAQFFYNETCRDATGIFQYYGDAIGYTAGLGIDPPGDGWLRLVEMRTSQNGYVLLERTFPSTMGVTIEFDFKVWSSSSLGIADGFCVFLFDGSGARPFRIGTSGGNLGYVGLVPAYLGIGIDEWGNYWNCVGGSGTRQSAITIADASYHYVAGTAAYLGNGTYLEYRSPAASRPSDAAYYRRVRIEILPVANGMSVTVYLKMQPAGNFTPVLGPVDVIQPTPALLRLGFNAATGASYGYHEVRDVIVRTPGDISVFKSAPDGCAESREHVVIHTIISNSTNIAVTGVNVNDTLPAGYTITGGVPTTSAAGTIHNFTTSTLADGRTRCTYTADVEAEAVAYITYTGSFAAMPAGGSYASSVGVVPPPSFEDQNESDNYSLFTGCITYPLTPDTIVAAKGGAVRFDALWNDSLPCPAVNATTGIIPGAGQHRGEATINPDRTFTYRAHTAGVDSFAYYVVCNDDSSTTKVYVLVLSPLAQTYVACPGATVTLGFTPLAGVTCNWYAHAAGGAILRSATTMSVVKGSASDLGTWWVEPVYDGVVFPRYRVDLEASDHCGATTTTGCAANGTLLFKEDFGGNAPSDPSVKPTGIPQVVGYTYLPDLNGQGVYTIAKQSPNYTHAESWYLLDDHTFPDDPSRGYLAGFDASAAPGQFYEYRINDLCVGTRLYFSAWLASLISNLTHVDKSNLIFVVENTAGDVLARFHTGNLPDADPRWKNYGFAFTAPESSVVLKILNNGAGSSGNDFVMDDIEIRFCASEVALTTRDTSVCAGAALAFDGHYTDNGLFGDHLAARWEFSLTGAIHVPDDWTAVAGSETTVTDGVVNSHYALAGLTPANAGYYRLVVASPDNIANFNCRAMSPVVRIQVDTVAPPPTVYSADPQAFCTGGAALLTADAPDAVSYQWYFNNTPLAGATADTCVAAATGSYTLRIRNLHDCPSAMSPAWTITVHPFPDVPTLAAAAATFCAGQSVALTAGAAGGLVYYWFRDNTPIDTTTPDPVLHTSVPGTYRVETGGAGGCRAAAPSNEITLTALPAPDTPTLDATQTDFCAGQSATLVAAAAGADEYEWYKDALLIDALTAPVRTVYETGLYSVKARNRYRCYAPHDAEPLMITRHDLPRTPIIVADGPPFYLDWDYTLSLQTTEHAVEYHWYKNAASTGVRDSLFPLPLIARAAAGAYTVEALSEYGCRAASEPFVVALEASPLFIPNIFTPNNDGVNDHFRITGLDNYDGNDLLVINKRGKTVFSAVNYRNTWYGDNQPDDVYYFRLRLREKSGDITLHEGYVHIKRK